MNRLYFLLFVSLLSCTSNRTVTNKNNPNDFKGKITQISKSENETFYQSSCSGIVIDHESKESLAYVHILLLGAFKSYETDSDSSGIFYINQLNSGNYKIKAFYLGYYPLIDSLYLEIGKNTKIQVDLYEDPNAIFN
jgi:hypothetical protein